MQPIVLNIREADPGAGASYISMTTELYSHKSMGSVSHTAAGRGLRPCSQTEPIGCQTNTQQFLRAGLTRMGSVNQLA